MAQYGPEEWFYPDGTLAVNQRAAVFGPGNDNVYASIFSDAGLTNPLPNPTTTNANGELEFFAADGTYWVHVGPVNGGDSVEIFLGASPNNPVLSINGLTPDGGGNVALAAADVGADPAGAAAGAAAASQPLATIDAKGDLYVGTADNTTGRLAVGSNGQILSANSATTTGLEWIAAPSAPVSSVNSQTGAVVLDASDVGALAIANDLSELNDVSDARDNLGLGNSATLDVGTAAGTVAAGDDSRITGAVQSGTVDAKGDLLVGTADNTIARQAVGSNGQVLTANSATTTGVEWAAIPSAPVTSVNAQTGAVVLGAGDVGALAVANDLSDLNDPADARDNLGLGTAATADTGTGTSNVVLGNDARLTDARTPTAHASTHEDGGADEIEISQAQVTNLTTDLGGKQDRSTLTTKGDLYVATAAATVARLPVGTDGFVLTAASGATEGMEWAAIPAAPVTSVNGQTGAVNLTATDVGLGNVDNTSDASKPVSTAQDTAIKGVFARTSSSFSGPTNVNVAAADEFNAWRQFDASIGAFTGTTTITLQTTNAQGGDVRSMRFAVDAGAGTVEFRNATSGGTLLGTLPAGGGNFKVFSTYTGTAWQPVLILRETIQSLVDAAIPRTIFAAKGDLISASADDTPSILSVGTDGHILTANSATTTGLEWVAPPTPPTPVHTQTLTFGDDRNVLSTGGGLARWYNYTGYDLTILGVWASVGIAPIDDDILIDVHLDGTTIFTTQANRPEISDGTNVSAVAVPDVDEIQDGEYLTIDIDQVGSTLPGGHLTVGVVVEYSG